MYLRFLLTLLLAPAFLPAQEFAPLGATWHYDMLPGICLCDGYYKVVSTQDTLFMGRPSRQLAVTRHYSPNSVSPPDFRYCSQQGDSIYLFDESVEDWCLLYDFSREPGEHWLYHADPFTGDSVTYTVLSKDTVDVNGTARRAWMVESSGYLTWCGTGGSMIQGIGGIDGWLFPWSWTWDFDIPEGLRCYEDSIVGFYERPISYGCDSIMYLTGSQEANAPMTISVRNPVEEEAVLEGLLPGDLVELRSIQGTLAFHQKAEAGTLVVPTAKLSKGGYLLTVQRSGSPTYSRKLWVTHTW